MSGPADQDALMRRALAEIRQLRARVAELEADRAQPIAIIGIGCRYPGGADSPEALWATTRAGQDAIGPYPEDRRAAFLATPAQPAGSPPLGGFLDTIDGFDTGFFDLSPREAQSMDPRQRLLLEVCHESLEDALIPARRLAGSRTGLFLGIYNDDFAQLHVRLDRPDGLDAYLGTGTSHSIAAGRLAYQLDLRGPALALDAACASSLAAVHLACASLRGGESDLALAAGVNLILSPLFGMITDRMGMMAPDGRCKPFDARADGFVRSEGCGVVVLKRLADALADGDPIRAVIHGSAMNQDGSTNGITAPNGRAQQAVIAAALADAGIDARDVGYVECHGTGTPLGDPVEVDALAGIYGAGRATPCALGSVKANIGHTEAAAGVAGLIRAVMALERREIPAVAHFATPNPHLELGTGLTVPRAPTRWTDAVPHAAVSAFGWSGSNVHVVLGSAPEMDRPAVTDSLGAAGHLLPLSAASAPALEHLADRFIDRLATGTTDIAALCRAAWHGRDQRRHRVVVRGTDAADLGQKLAAWRRGDPAAAGVRSGVVPATAGRTVLVFAGQGGQWPGMGRRLIAEDLLFRAAFERVSQTTAPLEGRTLVDDLIAADRFDRVDVIQPLVFAMQVALAEWLRVHGVRIDAVTGHSMGEVAAAVVAGALSLEDGARVIRCRSRLLLAIAGAGSMLLVDTAETEAEAAIAPWQSDVAIAAINGPRTTILSGATAAMLAVQAEFDRRGVFCRPVRVDVASHSPQVEPLLASLTAELAGIAPRATTSGIRFWSTVTGGEIAGAALDAGYWAANLRQPVRFAEALRGLAADGANILVEVNAHPVLAPAMRDGLNGAGAVVELTRRDEPEAEALLDAIAGIHAAGGVVDPAALYARRPAARLPTIAWDRVPCARPVLPVAGAPAAVSGADEPGIYEIDWQPLPDPAPAVAAPGRRWHLLDGGPAAADGLGDALARELEAAGAEVVMTRLTDPRQIDTLFTRADRDAAVGIVWLAGRAPEGGPDVDPVMAQDWQATAALRLTHRLSALAGDADVPPVWLVTRGAETVDGDTAVAGGYIIGQSALRGFLRVAATEAAGPVLRLVDLCATLPSGGEARSLARHLLENSAEDHVALRGDRRLAARLRRRTSADTATAPRLDGGGTYLVTGGLGGVGLRLTAQLGDWGARRIALIGRNPPGPAAQAALAGLAARGIDVQVLAADVADADALSAAVDTIRAGAPLKGIFHAAATLDDAVIDTLDADRMTLVMGAKLAGAWNLHRLTATDALDWFVLFTSAAGLLGTPGQANYAAANTAVDALASLRHAAGLPAHAIAWGPWAEVGLAAADARRGQRLAARGLASMTPSACFSALARVLAGPGGASAIMQFDRDVWAAHYPGSAARPFLAGGVTQDRATRPASLPVSGQDLAEALRAAAAGQPRKALLAARLATEIAAVLRTDPARVRDDEPLRALGLDSLMALELRTRLEHLTGLRLPATLAWTYPTPGRIAAHLAERLGMADPVPVAAAKPSRASPRPSDLDGLSDDEALRLLVQSAD